MADDFEVPAEYENQDGIWRRPETRDEQTAFDERQARSLMRVEDVSWWFQYRGRLIGKIAERCLDKSKPVFDIGGGNGYTSRVLQRLGWQAVLLEPSLSECKNAKARGIQTVVCNALNEEDFPEGTVPQAVMLDVLEHIEDAPGMLKLLATSVHSGGTVVFTVPAYSCLWSSEDDAAGHFRRYGREELVRQCEAAGFHVEYSSYFFSFLWLPILLLRTGAERVGLLKRADERTEEENRKVMDRQFRHPSRIVDAVLSGFEHFEARRILAGKRLPFGSSVLVVARKPVYSENAHTREQCK